MRKGHNGLLALVEQELCRDSLNGALYLFSNRSRTLLKGIFWDRTGYCVISKKLERGKFSIALSDKTVELDSKSLRLLLDGLNLFL
jgi:transposase